MSALPVVASPRTVDDLAEIWDWVAVDDLQAADRVLAEIQRALQRISEQPELGRTRPELTQGLRSLPCGRYLIFYRVHDALVEFVRILHGNRDIGALL